MFVSKIVQRGVCEVFLKVVLKRVSFVMALVSIRTRIKCCLLKMFQSESVGV